MSGEIVRRATSPVAASHILEKDEFDRTWRMAQALAASGMFKDVTQSEQAFGRILLGRDLGLTPTQALMSVDVVEGNVQVRAVRLAAWVREHPDYDYKILEHDEQHCVIEFFEMSDDGSRVPFEPRALSSFSMEDAAKARLIKEHPKSPWRAHPRNMLFARAMSNGVKWYCPEVTGGIPVYTEADVFEGTAVEVALGEGDGSEPGWGDLAPELVGQVEAVIAAAGEVGFAGFSDRATIQMLLAGRDAEAVGEWLVEARAQLEALGGSDGAAS